MNTTLRHVGFAVSASFAAAALIGCGGGGGSSAPAPAPAPAMGTLAVSLTDAPACGFDTVNVTVNKVRVHQSASAADTDSGWTDITLSPARKIDLLKLNNGVLDALGQTALAPGHYSQLRLVLDANSGAGMANTVVPTGSTTERTLETPSAVQSGIKLSNEFDVAAGQRVDLVLDFDACKSVVTRGNGKYALKPVVKVIPTAINGIAGFVATPLLASHVVISAQQAGVIVSATAPNPTTGEFFLSRVPAGSYDVVITADDHATSVIATVPVTASATTALSTAAAPLAMANSVSADISGVASLTPASTTEVAYLSAKQSFAAGPTVTIKYQGADLLTGSYTIARLPVAAPQYALYSATLPLQFSPAASVLPGVGKYRVDAMATGYASKTLALVDLSAASQSNVNFALTP